ncbi:hypothetical protein [Rhodopirellula halodulae]|uniref:hypothetical protein n=1 Tax=Rhodopirellula halodulae TaxID=2894198 RepID=UPI001E605C3F|nr:hypothetical protein [Rhodopirellula sp. JC737]MCC9658193.1 hypothetical protein [Rhodopirellula sp. JC737]
MSARLIAVAVAAICLFTAEANAQVTASSYSNGGTAISTASGRGNTRLNARSYATNGGFARADMRGSGRNGGFASGNSSAFANGGVAISNGRSIANGYGARSHANSTARTFGGYSNSSSTAKALGNWANARSDSTANSWFGQSSHSHAKAVDRRWVPQPQPYCPPTQNPIVPW